VRPLQSIGMGLVVVALSARVRGYDVLADPLGWALVLHGLLRLPAGLRRRGTAVALTGLALTVSVPLWLPGVVDSLADADDSLVWAAGLPQVAAVAALCTGLRDAAAGAGDAGAARWLRTARDLTLAVGVLPIVVYPVAPDLLGPLLALAVGTLLLVIVLLFRYSARPWALDAGARGAEHPAPV
jgi:hypothetical protein